MKSYFQFLLELDVKNKIKWKILAVFHYLYHLLFFVLFWNSDFNKPSIFFGLLCTIGTMSDYYSIQTDKKYTITLFGIVLIVLSVLFFPSDLVFQRFGDSGAVLSFLDLSFLVLWLVTSFRMRKIKKNILSESQKFNSEKVS